MDESPPPRLHAKSFFTYRRITTGLYAYAGIINPIICFGCAAPSGNWLADRPWQSGEFWVYATLMLKWPAVLPFYPILLYSMTCLGLLLWDWQRFAKHFAVQIGVYGGVALSILFGGLLFGTANQPGRAVAETLMALVMIAGATVVGLTFLAAVLLVLHAAAAALAEMLGGWSRLVALGVVLLLSACLAIAITVDASEVGDVVGVVLFVPLFTILACGPTWSLLAYSSASIQLLTRNRPDKWRWTITDALLLTGWIAAAFAAWRKSMDLAIEEYATLPTENPSCFVCAAAARGHAWLVRSETVAIGNRRRLVTHQLRVLKAAEVVLRASSPRTHRALRTIYDRIGPVIANRLTNPLLADWTYLALKPAEWLTVVALRIVVGVGRARINSLFSSELRLSNSPADA